MGITVPMNVAKNLETTASKSLFIDVPKDGSITVRFLPAVEGSGGSLFGLTKNHFRLKAEDGEKGIAVACKKIHGEGRCILCDVQEYLAGSDDKNEKILGDGRESIRANNSWYAQVLPAIRQEGTGPAVFTYGDTKLLRLPKTGAAKIGKILAMQQEAGEAFFTDEDEGRNVVVTRQDTGVQFTQYDAMVAGKPAALKDIRPTWETDIFNWTKFWEKLDLTLMDEEEQKVCLMRSYPNLDWAEIFEAVGA